MAKIVQFLFMVVVLTTSGESSNYDNGEFYNELLNKRYYYDNNDRSYDESISFCKSYNGQLVQIKSANESNWIKDNLPMTFMVNAPILGAIVKYQIFIH